MTRRADKKTRYHALIIGNNEAVPDIGKVAAGLKNWNCWTDDKIGRISYGLVKKRPGAKKGKNLTGSEIIAAIKKWRKGIDGDDVALFWYIGHSGLEPDPKGEDDPDPDERWNDPKQDNDEKENDAENTRNKDEYFALTRGGSSRGREKAKNKALDDQIGSELDLIAAGATRVAVFNTCYAYGQHGGTKDLGDDEFDHAALIASSPEGLKTRIDAKWSAHVVKGLFDKSGNGKADADKWTADPQDNTPDGKIIAMELAQWAQDEDPDQHTQFKVKFDQNDPANRPIFTGLNNDQSFTPVDDWADPGDGIPGSGWCADPDCGDAPDGGQVCWGVSRWYRTQRRYNGPVYNEWLLQCLGADVNNEEDGQPGCSAGADDYDDGVARMPFSVFVTVTIDHPDPKNYRLDAWFDVNDDGVFDKGSEHIIDSRLDYDGFSGGLLRDLTTGVYLYRYALTFNPRKVYCRFRLTFGIDLSVAILSHDGETPYQQGYVAPDGAIHGEVEDYPPIRGCGIFSLFDTLWITDGYAYDAANGNALSGLGVFGSLYDLRLADDFEVSANDYPDGFIVECVTADYLTFWGSPPADGVFVRVYDDDNGKPLEPPIYEAQVFDATSESFFDPIFDLLGVRVTADGLGFELEPGRYWINVQPVDTTAQGDWYYQVRDLNDVVGHDTHVRDGDLGEGGYGHTDWRSTGEDGFGAGTAAMQILGDAAPCKPPTIVEQPAEQEVCELLGMATFSVVADGPGPLGYQWRNYDGDLDEWLDIPGANEASYTIDGAVADDGGEYSVVVSNGCDAVPSDPATLLVNEAPDIAFQPEDEQGCTGGSVILSVSAYSAPPTSYQWRKYDDDSGLWVDIPGATDYLHEIAPVTVDDAGAYDVVVTNGCGAVISDPATLTVGTPGPLDNGVIRAAFSDYGTSGRRFAQPPVPGDIAWLDISGDSQVYSWEGNLRYDEGAGPVNHLLADPDEFTVDLPACRFDNTVISGSHNDGFAIVATHWLNGATLTTQIDITNTLAGDLTNVDFAWIMDADLVLPEGYEKQPCCPNIPWLGYGSGKWDGSAGEGVQNNLNPCAGVRPANMAVVHTARMDGTVVPGAWTVSNPVGFQGGTCAFDGEAQAEPRFLFETPFDNTVGVVGYDQDLGIVTNFHVADWQAGATHTFTYTLTFRSPDTGEGGRDGTPAEPVEIRRLPPP